MLYDNLKSAVLERQGDAIRFHPTLLEFAAHYRFEPRPVAVARGNEKGRVERSIRYIRDSFFAARQWRDLDDLNTQAAAWCQGQAADRPCPEDRSISVREAFAREQPKLLALPDNPFPTDEREAVSAAKTPMCASTATITPFPHTHVRRTLTVVASPSEVRVLDGAAVIAAHPRSYDKGEQVEDPAHIAELTAQKHQARQHRGTDRLVQAAPPAASYSPGPPSVATTSDPSPPPCCACSSATAPLSSKRGSARPCRVACPIPMRCVWHWSDAASSASNPHRYRSPCRRISGCETWWSPPTSSMTTTNCKPIRRRR